MIATEFGIIWELDKSRVYMEYEPEKYACVAIDDDLYINDWWKELKKMHTYFGELDKPAKGLCRHGITLIPPEELKYFEKAVKNDKRLQRDQSLQKLLHLIRKARKENKYMIHFGV